MAVLLPVGRTQYFDMDGRPLAGGKLYSYAANTTTAQATYTTKQATVAQPNPVVLDAGGYVPATGVWGGPNPYKLMMTDANGNTMWTIDDIQGAGASGVGVVSVDNIAALRALTGGSSYAVIVAGYTTPGDQGGGVFLWKTASTVTDDNGINIKSTDTATGRWKRQFTGDAIDIRWFGALADGTTDASTAIASADAYANYAALHTPDIEHPFVLDLVIATGTYKLTNTINVASFVRMEPKAVFDWSGKNINPALKPIIAENDYTVHFTPAGKDYYPVLVCNYVRPEWFTGEDLTYAIYAQNSGIVKLRNRGYTYTLATTFTPAGITLIGDTIPLNVGTSFQYGSYITRGAADLTFDGTNNLHIENVGFTGAGGNALVIKNAYNVSLKNVLAVATTTCIDLSNCGHLSADNVRTYLAGTGMKLAIVNSVLSNVCCYGHATRAINFVNTDTVHCYDNILSNVLIEASDPNCINDKGISIDNSLATTSSNDITGIVINGIVAHSITPVVTIAGAPTAGQATIKNISINGLKADVVTGTLVKVAATGKYDQATCKFGDAGLITDGNTWDGYYAGLVAVDNLYEAKSIKIQSRFIGGVTSAAASSPYTLTDYIPFATRNVTMSYADAVMDLSNIGTITAQGAIITPIFSWVTPSCTVTPSAGTVTDSVFLSWKIGNYATLQGRLKVGTAGATVWEIVVPAEYAWAADYAYAIDPWPMMWSSVYQDGSVYKFGYVIPDASTTTKFLVYAPEGVTAANNDKLAFTLTYKTAV